MATSTTTRRAVRDHPEAMAAVLRQLSYPVEPPVQAARGCEGEDRSPSPTFREGLAMSSEQTPGTRSERGTEAGRNVDPRAEPQAEERADRAEDKRRQQDLDEAEMGGES